MLSVWEDCAGQSFPQRALRMLMAAHPGQSADALAALSIGRRDAELVALRQALWGPEMVTVAACPACRERMETILDARQILAVLQPAQPEAISIQIAGYDLTFRLPTSLDLIPAAGEIVVEAYRDILLKRCLLSMQFDGNSLDADALPEAAVAAIAQSMAEADPLADIQLGVKCPSCAHQGSIAFDIVSFLWVEIQAWAMRILNDVHALASAYGWNERDILDLSPLRRQHYLEILGA